MIDSFSEFQKRRFEQLTGIKKQNIYKHVYNEVVISALNFIRDYQGEFYAAEIQEGEDIETENFHNRLFISTMEALGYSSALIEKNHFILDGDYDFFLPQTEITTAYKYTFGLKDKSLINIIKNYAEISGNEEDMKIINCALYNYIQLFHDHLHGDENNLFLSREQSLEVAKKNGRKKLEKVLEFLNENPTYMLFFSGIDDKYHLYDLDLCEFEEQKKPALYLV
jgi:hypothetical protein